MNQDQALEQAKSPEKIISPTDCTIIIGFLNGELTDLEVLEWEQQLIAGQHLVKLLNDPESTNKLAEARYKISEEYVAWQETVRSIRKFKAFRDNLKRRHDDLANVKGFIRNQ